MSISDLHSSVNQKVTTSRTQPQHDTLCNSQ